MNVADLLGSNGPLAKQPGFAPRLQQQQMAVAVDAILQDGGTLIVEAGTGTGKTYAYLIPVLRSGKRVIISTGTRHLQDQLYHRDLPVVRKALKSQIKIALLKGRSNYLCPYRLRATLQDGRLPSLDHAMAILRKWLMYQKIRRSGHGSRPRLITVWAATARITRTAFSPKRAAKRNRRNYWSLTITCSLPT